MMNVKTNKNSILDMSNINPLLDPKSAEFDQFNYMVKLLLKNENKAYQQIGKRIFSTILASNPNDIVKSTYIVADKKWTVYHGPTFKMTFNEERSYNCFFSKLSGFNCRFGLTVEDDPVCCELGFEILDLEISQNGCVPVPGSTNCRYCYKNNTNAKPTNMTFDTFKQIVDSCAHNLTQIAFGITGLKTNPDMEKMFKYCREIGVIPNVTTVGADLDDSMLDVLTKWCGAVAVSCYTGAKQLCYDNIKKIHDYAMEKYKRDMHVNMHIVVSKDNMSHLKEVLADIAAGKVPGLRSVVLLRIKPRGRAANMDCVVTSDMYREIITYCLDNNISFGFDSCSAKAVEKVLCEIGKSELTNCCESCESSRLSAYINVNGEYWNCSFCEGNSDVMATPINVLNFERAFDWWNLPPVLACRYPKTSACESCPWYKLD